MRMLILRTLIVAALLVAATQPLVAHAARLELPTILVDLAHGQQYNGVCAMMSVVPDAYWIILVKDEEQAQQLPECIKNKAYEIVVGDLTVLGSGPTIDMVIIGQPIEPLSDAEKEAIAGWFGGKGHRALWCAADSDYPAQGGNLELSQHICNDLLDYLAQKGFDVKLRSDYVSIEDTKSNAGRSYRVIALVEPAPRYDAELLALGAEKVLMHGPGAVAWVDKNGDWHKVTDPGTPDTIIPILVTTENGKVVEHQPKNPGEPGEFGYAHQVGETGKFVLMAAEIVKTNNGDKIVIVSGESPYFGYQSMVTYSYKGIPLDGPRFFRNLILWATKSYNELKIFKSQLAAIEEAKTAAQQAAKQAEEAKQAAAQATTEAKSYVDQKLGEIQKAVNEVLQRNINKIMEQVKAYVDQKVGSTAGAVDEAKAAASSAKTIAAGGLVLGIIALLAAGLALRKNG
ncbi:hypothetical protein [Pyrodictium abyssi]|uniref:ABC transporter n=1 Tax=Pyrodictium abyssi TaxID=54256 RepID=A0ABM8IXH5_9CREN|nr:ABC transporter [Pyrodictium abyssi]